MPLAKIYVNEGQYDEARLTKISDAVQAALRSTLSVPPDDFFQLIFEMPRNHYLHTASFVGMQYTDDLVTLEILFVSGRSRETRLALLKDLDTRIAAAASISPDDVFINLVEVPGENISFGQGEAQRANAVEYKRTHANRALRAADRLRLRTVAGARRLGYSPECVEGEFCEVGLPIYGVLGS